MKIADLRSKKSGPSSKFEQFLQRRSVKYGLPFLLVVLGGSFGLKEFTQLRYQFSQSSQVKRSDLDKLGIKKREEVTLETEYEKVKKLNIDDWEQVRGPRPWEEAQ